MTDEPSKTLERYIGLLTPSQVADGMNAAHENAKRLAADARILLDADRFASAASIAVLSIEESGKRSLLRSISIAKDAAQAKIAWKESRSHRSKNYMWMLPDYVQRGAIKLDDLKGLVDKTGEHTALLDAVKQLGLYTDCYAKAHWSIPARVIEKDLAGQLVSTAELLCRADNVVTTREVELWVKHVGPHAGSPEMRHGLIRWHQAMVAEGLTAESQETFERFVLGPEAKPAVPKKFN